MVFRPDAVHGDRSSALRIELLRGATLRGRVHRAPPLEKLVVSVHARGIDYSVGTGSGGGAAIDRVRELLGDGTWEVRDLPPRAGLEVKLRKEGKQGAVVLALPDRIYLEPGEERYLELSLGDGCLLRGRVVLEGGGEPIRGHPVWLVPAKYVWGPLASHHESLTAAVAETDEAGTFVLDGLSAGEWVVGLSPLRGSPEGIAAVAARVSLSKLAPVQEVELRCHRDLFIEGRVLDSNGEEANSVRVRCHSEEPPYGASDITGDDGIFRLGPLLAGSYALRTLGDRDRAPSDRVLAAAGDRDVVLITKPAGTIRGRLVDPVTAEPVAGSVQVSQTDGEGGYSTGTRPDGTFVLMSLVHGTYVVSGSSGTRVGLVAEVSVDEARPEVEIEIPLQEGARLEIVYTGEHPYVELYLESRETRKPWSHGRFDRGRTLRSVVMPGRVTVTAIPEAADGPREPIVRILEVEVGETTLEIGDE